MRTMLGQLVAAFGYAGGYYALWLVSFSHWGLYSGFRLCVLLVVPYRFWVALALGEMLPLSDIALHGNVFGLMWSLVMMVPPVSLAMPVVYWFRERTSLMRARGEEAMSALLLCTALTSLVWMLADVAALAVANGPMIGHTIPEMGAKYFLGNYIGALTVVPSMLVFRQVKGADLLPSQLPRFLESRLVLESASLLLPALALLAWLASRTRGDIADVARMAMFLPVAWLSLRHGWQGAAIGGAAASFAVVLAMPHVYDKSTVQAEVFIAVTMSSMLLLGGRIAALHQREQRDSIAYRSILALAQRNVRLGELQLKQTSQAIERLGHSVALTQGQLLVHLERSELPDAERMAYVGEAEATSIKVRQLAESLYPLREPRRGLVDVLCDGQIACSLRQRGIAYYCVVDPRSSCLSRDLQLALYRSACDMVAYLCLRGVGQVTLTLRTMLSMGRAKAVLAVDASTLGLLRPAELPSLPLFTSASVSLSAIKDRASVYEGWTRVRHRSHGQRLSLIMFDLAG